MENTTVQNGTQPPPPPDLHITNQHLNPIGPRYQWENNNGYCGEVSFISAGLYYGQYLSQYDVRALVCTDQNTQVLLGDNDATVAGLLKLDAEVCAINNSIAFLKWVKRNVVNGYPVIIGVFNNEFLIYQNTNPYKGDSEYDHIVPVMGWGSSRPLDQEDISGDVILLSDNGLYGPDTGPVPDDSVAYYYYYSIPCFLADRALANTETDPNRIYSLLSLLDNGSALRDYAIAIKGVADENKETLPVRITTSINYEAPAIEDGSAIRPAPLPVTLSITVSGMTPGQTYYVYYYTNENDVPKRDFNAASGDAWQVIDATTETWTGSMTIQSDQKAFFRAVNKNAG